VLEYEEEEEEEEEEVVVDSHLLPRLSCLLEISASSPV
jgi:hypothetical protein